MNLSKIFVYFLTSVLLLGLSGSFLTAFQTWIAQQSSEAHNPVQAVSVSGIRQIISTPKAESVEVSSPQLWSETKHDELIVDTNSYPQYQTVDVVQKVEKEGYEKKPTLVLFENALALEFPKSIATAQNVKRAMARLLLSENPFKEFDLLSTKRLDLSKRPYLLYHVVNQYGESIQYPKQAYDFAEYLLEESAKEIHDESGSYLFIKIPLAKAGLKGKAKNYQVWVDDYAQEFDISPALVYAVMETESAFNPKAVSRSNAIGLMQVKANAAGADVYKHVDGRQDAPTKYDLFNSENNIRMGTAYLGLLHHNYLAEIEDSKVKKMLAISSYNGGMSTVLKLFGKTTEEALAKVNRLKPNQVYRKLRYEHASDETRRYLDKVLKAENKYQKLLSVKEL